MFTYVHIYIYIYIYSLSPRPLVGQTNFGVSQGPGLDRPEYNPKTPKPSKPPGPNYNQPRELGLCRVPNPTTARITKIGRSTPRGSSIVFMHFRFSTDFT